MKPSDIYVVVVDISGYTEFSKAHSLNQMHAEKIVGDLLETVIEHMGTPLVVNKLMGDAVLAFADAGDTATGDRIATVVPALFDAFRAKRDELVFCRVCICDACREVGDLKLKVFIHRTEAIMRRLGGFEEIGGEGVVLIHKLMKNSLKQREYVMVTDSAAGSVEPPTGFNSFSHRETVDVLGDVDVQVWTRTPEEAAVSGREASWLRAKASGVKQAWDLDVYYVKRRFMGLDKIRPLPQFDPPATPRDEA